MFSLSREKNIALLLSNTIMPQYTNSKISLNFILKHNKKSQYHVSCSILVSKH